MPDSVVWLGACSLHRHAVQIREYFRGDFFFHFSIDFWQLLAKERALNTGIIPPCKKNRVEYMAKT